MLSEHWNIGLIDASPAKVAFNWRRYRGRVRWFKPLPVKLFRADTFFFRHEEKPYVLCERFDYRTMKGLIELITLDKEYRFSSAKTAIDGEGHFSFPFTFSLDNQIYCIPETSATGLTNLYRFNPDIKRFEWERVLINQPLIDPVLVHYQNRWWLFATLPTNASGALYLWFAQSLDEPFIAHPENPVKTDVRSSRAAGPFMVLDGFLYRPAQNASRTYGGSIVINQVISLTPLEYIEQQVVELKPDDDWIFSAGMHTIAGDDKITVIDAKRHQFSPTASFNKLKRKLTYERKKSR
ncbi:MAG: hypothetical protein U1C46_00595 [Bacteroidales bacterium]|nr:hypothetical protein [Bacteroidales bacterium]